MLRTRAIALVLLLTACGGPADSGRLRPYLQSDQPPEPGSTESLQLEIARAADYQRAEEEVAPSEPVVGPSLEGALARLDAQRQAQAEVPLLFARATTSSDSYAIAPLDTRAWFDAHGHWVANEAALPVANDARGASHQLELIGGHLRGTSASGTAPVVVLTGPLPALVVLDVGANTLWINPQLLPLLPSAPPPPRPRPESSTSASSPSAAAAAALGVSGLTGGDGRFDNDTSVEACVTREANLCRDCLTGGGCDPVFPGEDGASECQSWSSNGDLGLNELCCAGLLLRSGAATCVTSTSAAACPFTSTALTSSSTLSQDATFAASPACLNALDQCLPSSGAGTNAVVPSAAAPSCGCNDDFGGCSDVADDCADLPSEACGSIVDGCSSYRDTPSTSPPDNELTSTSTSGGSGPTTASATSGSGSASGGETSSTEVSSGTGSGGETAGGSATGGEVTSGGGASSASASTDVGSAASSTGGSDDSGGCDSCGDSCGSDDSGCGSDCSGADCSGAGDCGGCSTTDPARRPRKPWKPAHEATFAAIAPVLALLVRRKR